MILCDHQIEAAIRSGLIVIDPEPERSQIKSTALDLRVGTDFRRWKKVLTTEGFRGSVDVANIEVASLLDLTEPVPADSDGIVEIQPNDFVLVLTLESLYLPASSKLAGRIEGRSTLARLGMSVHVTAPTIHGGFRGPIALEILNHGPFKIRIRPGIDCISQLILERVASVPKHDISTAFMRQTTPLGTPRKR